MHRVMGDGDAGFAGFDPGEHDAPIGDRADEIGGAVDRVDHPGEAGCAGFGAVFLAHDAVIGEGIGQGGAHEQFDLAIRLADEILMALLVDHQIVLFAEEIQGQRACIAGDFFCDCGFVLPIHC